MSDTPDGTADLISDVEEHVRLKRLDLEREERRLNELRDSTVILDEDGNTITTNRNEVAITDDGFRELDWVKNGRQEVEYKGETFNVRKPQPQALSAFAIVSSKHMPEDIQRNQLGLFVRNHMSPMSMERFMFRMMDPDDPDFGDSSMVDLFRLIATVGTGRPTGPSRG